MDVAVLAGSVSTALFVGSYLPMLLKAFRTKDLDSYSRGNLVLATIGNAVYSVYVFSLPLGPIWFLHSSYVIATLLMLVWHVRHAARADPARRAARRTRTTGTTTTSCPWRSESPLGRSGWRSRCPDSLARRRSCPHPRWSGSTSCGSSTDACAASRWPSSSLPQFGLPVGDAYD